MIERSKAFTDPINYTKDWEFLAKKSEALKSRVDGVDINEKNATDGNITALGYAVILGGNTEIIEALVDNGADINSEDDNKIGPLEYAAAYKNDKAIQLILGLINYKKMREEFPSWPRYKSSK